jgi:hypothetical protein
MPPENFAIASQPDSTLCQPIRANVTIELDDESEGRGLASASDETLHLSGRRFDALHKRHPTLSFCLNGSAEREAFNSYLPGRLHLTPIKSPATGGSGAELREDAGYAPGFGLL